MLIPTALTWTVAETERGNLGAKQKINFLEFHFYKKYLFQDDELFPGRPATSRSGSGCCCRRRGPLSRHPQEPLFDPRKAQPEAEDEAAVLLPLPGRHEQERGFCGRGLRWRRESPAAAAQSQEGQQRHQGEGGEVSGTSNSKTNVSCLNPLNTSQPAETLYMRRRIVIF